jgi:hypothetical protein
MIDLERSLGELADRLEIPGGDWLADDVMRRIAVPARPVRYRRALRIAGAALLVLVVVLIALPGPRRAVARWLGFDSVRIEQAPAVPTTPVPSTNVPASESSTIVTSTTIAVDEIALDLGASTSLDAAMAQTGLPDPTPSLLGTPQSVHVVEPPVAGQIVLVYVPSDLLPKSSVTGVGALVSVMPAKIEEGFFRKGLGGTATVQSVDVDGATGYWIEGSPHELLFQFGDADDNILPDTFRLATNALLWQRGDHVYRLEADIDLDTALRIAKSVP